MRETADVREPELRRQDFRSGSGESRRHAAEPLLTPSCLKKKEFP
jgi:hypothetical protein